MDRIGCRKGRIAFAGHLAPEGRLARVSARLLMLDEVYRACGEGAICGEPGIAWTARDGPLT